MAYRVRVVSRLAPAVSQSHGFHVGGTLGALWRPDRRPWSFFSNSLFAHRLVALRIIVSAFGIVIGAIEHLHVDSDPMVTASHAISIPR